jgi:hypothetical protein
VISSRLWGASVGGRGPSLLSLSSSCISIANSVAKTSLNAPPAALRCMLWLVLPAH